MTAVGVTAVEVTEAINDLTFGTIINIGSLFIL